MSTFPTDELDSSSDEDDQDFVPSSPKRKSAKRQRTSSSSSSTYPSNDAAAAAGPRVDYTTNEASIMEGEDRRRTVAETFAALREETLAAPNKGVEGKQAFEVVKVKRARRFAGETLYETVTLPSTDPEAIAYLTGQSASTVMIRPAQPPSAPVPNPAALQAVLPTTPTDPSRSFPVQTFASGKPRTKSTKPPARRIPRQSLEQMSAALSSGKKMTTLEKSQLDWKTHMASDQKVNDELETNRRSGGFLEKRDFLKRVGERRNGALDMGKGAQR